MAIPKSAEAESAKSPSTGCLDYRWRLGPIGCTVALLGRDSQVPREIQARPWRVMVVDDRPLPRLAAKAILTEVRELEFAGEAASGREAVALYPQLHPDIVLLDVQMPDQGGPETASRLLDLDPRALIIAWSVSDDGDDLVRMMQAGCSG